MMIDELREEYENTQVAFAYYDRDKDVSVREYRQTYEEFLKEKLTQPCPECEKHKRAVERLLNYTADDNDIIGNKEVMRKWAYGEDEE